jgi:hypothetical protein
LSVIMVAKVNARPSRQDEELPVRPRVEHYQGRIQIDSGPCGTTIHIKVPARANHGQSAVDTNVHFAHSRRHFEKTQAINEEIKFALRDIRGQIDQLRQCDV